MSQRVSATAAGAVHRILRPFGPDSALRRWGLSLAAPSGTKRGKRKAIVAVARKLAVILHAMWLKQQAWQPFPGGPREPSFSGALALTGIAPLRIFC